ncbi:hypothetical protein Aduo_005512 [Ancylostoma duodenale]
MSDDVHQDNNVQALAPDRLADEGREESDVLYGIAAAVDASDCLSMSERRWKSHVTLRESASRLIAS